MSFRTLLIGCAGFVLASCFPNVMPKTSGQNETKLLVESALYDFPIPSSSILVPERSVILGSGSGWSGRITLVDAMTQGELLSHMNQSVPASGWIMSSSAISDQIVLVYEKGNRVATVQISVAEKALFSFFSGAQTKIEIFVNSRENNLINLPNLID